MSIIVKGSGGGGGEDLTVELAEQATLLQEIEESLVGKASGANITPETVLEGYAGYKGKNLVVGTLKKPPEYGMFFNAINDDGYLTDVKIAYPNIPQYAFRSYNDTVTKYSTAFYYLEKMEVVADVIGMYAFYYLLYGLSVSSMKLKIKAKEIGNSAFAGIANSRNVALKTWISKDCEIMGSSIISGPSASSETTIYCEVESQPSDWSIIWTNTPSSGKKYTVVWGVTEAEFDAL